jgi:glycosyltransferase involved in cell wall biosynthesis
MSDKPLVSVLTPVYNGDQYLSEAIESVLNQSYENWEYVIVNNCSTDNTLAVAEGYAKTDPRIKVVTNDVFVDCESNHNNAFRLMSPRSHYCKVVSADDWLLPGALARFVDFAVDHPTVGIVGSYQKSGGAIRWTGLPPEVEVAAGREVCRLGLLHNLNVFGNPTSVLYRADLVRRTASFFPHNRPHADTSACYAHLHDCDFGFIHEVLTVERVHEARESSRVEFLDPGIPELLETLIDYGPRYLSASELAVRRVQVEARYYQVLARGVLKLRGRRYLEFHASQLRRLGLRLSKARVAMNVLTMVGAELVHPLAALRKFRAATGGQQSTSQHAS